MIGRFKKLLLREEQRQNITTKKIEPTTKIKKQYIPLGNNSEINSKELHKVLEKYKKKISKTPEIHSLREYLGNSNGKYTVLQNELKNLMTYIPEGYSATLRLKRWDGKILAQVGTVVHSKSRYIELETASGEYSLEFSIAPINQEEVRYQILWLGLDYAGKSSLIHRFRYNEFRSHSRTIGQDIEDFILEGLRLTTIDIGGQKSLREYWSQIPLQPDLIVYVIDVFDHQRYAETLDELQKHVLNQEKYKNIPILFLLNKIDLLEDQDASKVTVNKLQLNHYLDLRSWHAIPVSAKSGAGLEETIKKMSELILSKETR